MRGLLIVNQHATSITGTVSDLAVRSLAGLVDLDVERTQYRGHARDLAAAADVDLIIVHGGDGSINEVVNGVMGRDGTGPSRTGPSRTGASGTGASGTGPSRTGPSRTGASGTGPSRTGTSGTGASGTGEPGAGRPGQPLIAIIPGGGANVLARGLGLPVDAAAASRRLRESLAAGRYRTIGLGLAGERYFTFSAGLGWDAEVVGEVDRLRAEGHRESAALFLRTMVRSYYRATDRRQPALTLERDGEPPVGDLFMTIITNRSPWTYLYSRAVLPVPNPDFSSGLDLLAMRRLRLAGIVSAVGQMLYIRSRPPRGRDLLSVFGSEALTLRSSRPIAFHVDGEYLGETEAVKFQFVPHALRVVA